MTKSHTHKVLEQTHVSDAETSQPEGPSTPLHVVGIGASAGGLAALKKLFASIPEQADTPKQAGVCFVVVIHLSPDHESHLADLLQLTSRLPVQQVTGTIPLEANNIYVIPPDSNIDAIDTHLHLSQLEAHRRNRAPIDHFFHTLAEAHGEYSVGVILTGTGTDGTSGLRRIRALGGLTIVQSPDEAEYDSMPRSAIAAGVVDLVLPIDEIAAHILSSDRVARDIINSRNSAEDDKEQAEPGDQGTDSLHKILVEVGTQTGHDFTHYKHPTLLRRIDRRMKIHHTRSLGTYLEFLRAHDDEVEKLFEDLLITVTEFFRDPEVYEHLATKIIPELFKDNTGTDNIRVWSVGCATGEEAYSIAMLLLEEEARNTDTPKQIQIFATDIHEASLSKARQGAYPLSIKTDVSDRRLRQFFVKEAEHFQIRKLVRERIVFACHNVLQDPPFSHVQLITCRNLLIYLQRDIQKQVIAMFHYALKEDGYLVVGSAETVESDLFQCVDKQYGLYRRRSVPKRKPAAPAVRPPSPDARSHEHTEAPRITPGESYGALHEHVVELYAPPSILINPNGELVHYSVQAGRFLQWPGGTPSNNIFQLLPEPLKFELRTALLTARDDGGSYRSRPIDITLEGKPCQVLLRVQRIDQPRISGYFLAMFDEIDIATKHEPKGESTPSDANTRDLEAELTQTKKRMHILVEEYEATQEHNQAYNEELESTNEELRSTMEELETSKEEMQSINEELATLNQENFHKVEELKQLSGDLKNLLTATHIATVFLDRDMRIMRFTPSMAELFDLRDSDRGRSMTDIAHHLGYEQIEEDIQSLFKQLSTVEREICAKDDQWYLVRLQCYRTEEDRIEGVVITFTDITSHKQFEREIIAAKNVAEKVVDTVRNPMLALGNDLRVEFSNTTFSEYFKLPQDSIKDVLVYDLDKSLWKNTRLRQLLERILPENRTLDDFEIEYEPDAGHVRSLVLNARKIDHLDLILVAIEDVTERKQAQHAIERSHYLLEKQVAERTKKLNEQAVSLERLVDNLKFAEQRERKRMVSILHDDLQQVLVAVKMQLELAQAKTSGKSVSDTLRQAIQGIDESVDITRDLVRQVIPQVLYEQGLVPALRWLSEEMLRRHNLKVEIIADTEDPPLRDADKTLIFESLREILFNIVKHAGVDSALVTLNEDQEGLSITTSDEGCGFDVNSKAREIERSGFGLLSVDERIESIGGILAIDSAPGKGTEIHLRIPWTTATADDKSAQVGQTKELPPAPNNRIKSGKVIRVLVADDHALVREGIVQILNPIEHLQVTCEANDGIEAVAGVDRYHPDVVLMDVSMPRMDGIDATRKIHERWPEVIVIGLSMQDADEKSARAIVDAGAAAFLSKTAHADEIIQTIFRVMDVE